MMRCRRVQWVLQSAPRIISRTEVENRGEMLHILTAAKDERAHDLLRRFVDEGYDEAIRPLASLRDPKDLPRLGTVLNAAAAAQKDRLDYLPEILYTNFGKAAVPYLERALHASPGPFTGRNIAAQLMAAGDPMGFQFALRIITQPGGLRNSMIQTIRSRFPELKTADDERAIAFVKARAGN